MIKVKNLLKILREVDPEMDIVIPHLCIDRAVDYPSAVKIVTVDIDNNYYLGDLRNDFRGDNLKIACMIDYY
ncbi:MAG TPA: hypothetical protein PKE67_01075 [Chitinophagales bacterium]|nr:hypothetical protein [Chitinophagales bacterium]HMW93461.1 hypothetical protein [Chitinophagales bacterium]